MKRRAEISTYWPTGQKNRMPTRVMVIAGVLIGRLQRLLLDGYSVCYWTAAPFVVCGGASQIVLFLQRSKIFFLPPRCRTIFPFGCRGFTTNGGAFMKSLVIKRSVVVAGHKTSVSLEDAFWKGLKEIAGGRHMTLSDLVATIDSERQYGNLSSAIRLFVLEFYRARAGGEHTDINNGGNTPEATASPLRSE